MVFAEILWVYGLVPSSTDLQQFLLELDEAQQPTGRVAWRNTANSHIIEPILKKQQGHELLSHTREMNFPSRQVFTTDSEDVAIVFSPLRGLMHLHSKATQTVHTRIEELLMPQDDGSNVMNVWAQQFAKGVLGYLKRRGSKGLEKNVQIKVVQDELRVVFSNKTLSEIVNLRNIKLQWMRGHMSCQKLLLHSSDVK
jgi:hypothetical protein